MNNNEQIRAVDLEPERRPGVPALHRPEPVGYAHWNRPERQSPPLGLTIDAQRREATATFGTGQLPRGLSGILRRFAYRMPDYESRRWALLLLADRVDAIESRALAMASSPVTWMALFAGVGLFAAARYAAPRRRSPFDAIFR